MAYTGRPADAPAREAQYTLLLPRQQIRHKRGSVIFALSLSLCDGDLAVSGVGYGAWAPALQGLVGEQLAAAVRSPGPRIVQTVVAGYVRRPRFATSRL